MLMLMLFLIILAFLLIENENVSYKKIIPIVPGDPFVGLGNDIKNRLEVPESVVAKIICKVAKIICKCEDRLGLILATLVSNSPSILSSNARDGPFLGNEVGAMAVGTS